MSGALANGELPVSIKHFKLFASLYNKRIDAIGGTSFVACPGVVIPDHDSARLDVRPQSKTGLQYRFRVLGSVQVDKVETRFMWQPFDEFDLARLNKPEPTTVLTTEARQVL